MIFLKNFFINTTSGTDKVNIFPEVKRVIREAGISKGLMTVTPPVGGAGIAVASEGEIKGSPLVSRSLTLPFERGDLLLDPRQQLYLIDTETTGRRREFWVQVMGEEEPKKGLPPRGMPVRPAVVRK